MNPEEIKGLVEELRQLQGQFEGAASAEALKGIGDRMTALEVKLARPGVAGDEDKGASTAEAKAAFSKFLRTGEMNRKALVQDEEGQLLVTAEVEEGILKELREATFVEGLCEAQSISKNRSKAHKLTGVVTGFGKLELGDTLHEGGLTPGEHWIHVEDLNGLARVGNDELEDADVDIEGHISEEFGFSFAEDVEQAIFTGTGHTNRQFEGILTNSSVANIDCAAYGAVTADDILRLIHAVPRVYRKNGTLVVNDQTILALRLAKESNTGRYLWEPNTQAGEPPRFAGVPVYACSAVPAVGAQVGKVAVFGDFRRGYKIVTRRGVSIKRLVEKFALDGMTGYLATLRKGGAVTRPNALATLSGATAAPVVPGD
jgi:HK97 family phage major capsid protein